MIPITTSAAGRTQIPIASTTPRNSSTNGTDDRIDIALRQLDNLTVLYLKEQADER